MSISEVQDIIGGHLLQISTYTLPLISQIFRGGSSIFFSKPQKFSRLRRAKTKSGLSVVCLAAVLV